MGTTAWLNWRCFLDGTSSDERFQDELQSDREFSGASLDLGPYRLSPVIRRSGAIGPALLLSGQIHASLVPPLVVDGDLVDTNSEGYHGGGIGDELAALVSLCLGVRLRDAGTAMVVRMADGSSPGYQLNREVQRLRDPGSQRGELLPRCTDRATTLAGVARLATLPSLDESSEVALVRAARLYASAVWWANEDPNFAWLQLVSAIEAVTGHAAPDREDSQKLVKELWPELYAALDGAPDKVRGRVSRLLAHQIRAQRKFISFMITNSPPPPERRPEWDTLDWADLEGALRTVYGHRSTSLHSGKPLPLPMLQPPRADSQGVAQEVPGGLSAGAEGASWSAHEYPMLLTTFEYLVRGALLNWWDALPRR